MDEENEAIVRDYHQRTKHHLHRYAAGPHGLHWASQPDPFRRYEGAPHLVLPLLADGLSTLYRDCFHPNLSDAHPLNRDTLAVLLELALGLSAWKEYQGSRWALRCNPSSGNLHPTEGYVVCPKLDGLASGVYHYLSFDHSLEQRCQCVDLPLSDGFLIGLTSIHWREAWKYGERAFRYCQHDIGHALAAIRAVAAALGWRVQLLEQWGSNQIAALLGLDRATDFARAEPEEPELVLWVARSDCPPIEATRLLVAMRDGQWWGKANTLSTNPQREWPIIDRVAEASRKPVTFDLTRYTNCWPSLATSPCKLTAATLFRQRRSMQACDGHTELSSAAFYRLLDALLPRTDTMPWDAWPYAPRIHLLLFVHRVTGLEPGLYLLARDEAAKTFLVQALQGAQFDWRVPPDRPEHLPLWHLLSGDARQAAKVISCHQDIAADGTFSLGMLAAFEPVLAQGMWQYRRLFWEAGMIGQMLYLEAEAAGLQGTGIGCYFDDAMHELFGVRDSQWQCLYHFTIGRGVADSRLQTYPPYQHRM